MSYLFLFILGLAVGSFLNVLIDRLPREESIMGRSRCDECKTKLAWNDLIPVFSYLKLRGKCRYCKMNLSWQYPLVEMLTGVAFLLIFNFQFSIFKQYSNFQLPTSNFISLAILLGIVSTAIVIFFSDLKYRIIPDSMQILLFAFSFLLLVTVGLTPTVFLNHVAGAFVVMAPILFLFLVTKGGGMGFGDVKLAFSMGFLLGPLGGLASLYIAFVSGAVIGIFLFILKKKGLKSKIAFGPFLIAGLLIVLFFGDNIMFLLRNYYSL